ncbi:MAG: hypothetical protein HC836_46765 [Richelia sp. RM2_1_2]|nr:hypothetical protein [Richelia sp. RM2_1_2]
MSLILTQTGARTYSAENTFGEIIQVQVFRVDKNNYVHGNPPVIDTYVVGDGTTPLTVAVDATFTIAFTEDGAYQIRVNDTSLADDDPAKYTLYTLFSYVDLRTCVTKVIQNILCDENDCNECEEDYRYLLNRLIAVLFPYFAYLQSEYGGINTVFESINGYYPESKILDLFNIEDTLSFAKRLCENLENCGSDVTNLQGGCGC